MKPSHACREDEHSHSRKQRECDLKFLRGYILLGQWEKETAALWRIWIKFSG